jgi:hypothetical protein
MILITFKIGMFIQSIQTMTLITFKIGMFIQSYIYHETIPIKPYIIKYKTNNVILCFIFNYVSLN